MSEEQDDSQKTEQPTSRKLEEAHKRGQVPNSKEVSNFFILLVVTLLIAWMAGSMMRNTSQMLVPFLRDSGTMAIDSGTLYSMLKSTILLGLQVLFLPLLALVAAALASGFLQHGFMVSWDPVTPSFDKVSPMKGLKRLFSLRSVTELIKGIIKLTVVGLIAWHAVEGQLGHVKQLGNSDVYAMLIFLSTLVIKIMIGVCVAMFFIALFDFVYQRYEFIKSLRMSKQEIKDEYKQQEGDPHVKQKLKQLRMERARQRMMSAVPNADVVITNPTHYSIALKYDGATMKAPIVIAKGADFIALKIRELAKEKDIAIVENPPLARALYATVDIDEEIPFEHYKAVAEIISYVYKIKGKDVR